MAQSPSAPQTSYRSPGGPDPSPDADVVGRYLELLIPDPDALPVGSVLAVSHTTETGGFATEFFPAAGVLGPVVAHVLDANRSACVYFRMSALRAVPDSGRGTDDDTAAAFALFADVDIGEEGHKGAGGRPGTLEEALDALDAVFAPEIAPSLIVHSGGGVYPIWPFKEPWTLDSPMERERYRHQLRRVQAHLAWHWRERGWTLDSTGDLSRVLRVAGTVNRKIPDHPRPTGILREQGARFDPTDLEDFLLQDDVLGLTLRGSVTAQAAVVTLPGAFPPADLARIEAACGFMAHCRDDAAGLPEPHWAAAMTVYAACDDGEQWAHERSSPYAKDGRRRYSSGATKKKLAAAAKVSPVTCRHVAALDGLAFPGCATCPAKAADPGLKSPVQLGRDAAANRPTPQRQPPPPHEEGVFEDCEDVTGGAPPDDGAPKIGRAAPPAGKGKPPAEDEAEEPVGPPPEPKVVRLADVESRPVRWLWRGRVPFGADTDFQGDPDEGKSLITIDVAARITRGRPMPDGSASDLDGPRDVLFVTSEDALDTTIRPRLLAAGGDPDRVHVLTSVPEPIRKFVKGEEVITGWRWVPPEWPEHARVIHREAERVGAVLIVADPITAHLGDKVNPNSDRSIRRALAETGLWVQGGDRAFVIVRHLNKMSTETNAKYRGAGTIAFLGLARSSLLVAPDPDDDPEAGGAGERRVLAVLKHNLSSPREGASLGYRITTTPDGKTPYIEWLGQSAHTAQSLLRPVDPEDTSALGEAKRFLEAYLSQPRSADDVAREARKLSISAATLRRARTALGVTPVPVRTDDGVAIKYWEWPAVGSRATPAHTPAGFEHLAPNPPSYQIGTLDAQALEHLGVGVRPFEQLELAAQAGGLGAQEPRENGLGAHRDEHLGNRVKNGPLQDREVAPGGALDALGAQTHGVYGEEADEDDEALSAVFAPGGDDDPGEAGEDRGEEEEEEEGVWTF